MIAFYSNSQNCYFFHAHPKPWDHDAVRIIVNSTKMKQLSQR